MAILEGLEKEQSSEDFYLEVGIKMRFQPLSPMKDNFLNLHLVTFFKEGRKTTLLFTCPNSGVRVPTIYSSLPHTVLLSFLNISELAI